MEEQAGETFSHTADYTYIESALKARWEPFTTLVEQFDSFSPRPYADFAGDRESEIARLVELNPTSTRESIEELVDRQIGIAANPNYQLVTEFSARIMSEYVTVTLLSHALVEAVINATLAVGLARAGAPELFALLERADVKEKWSAGPKAFHPTYSLDRGGALWETLQHLTYQRNTFVHYKIELQMNGEKKLPGSKVRRSPLRGELIWVERFFSLPYDLVSHLQSQMPLFPALTLFDSRPIRRYQPHSAVPGAPARP